MNMLIQGSTPIKPQKSSVLSSSMEFIKNEVEPKLSRRRAEKIFGEKR